MLKEKGRTGEIVVEDKINGKGARIRSLRDDPSRSLVRIRITYPGVIHMAFVEAAKKKNIDIFGK